MSSDTAHFIIEVAMMLVICFLLVIIGDDSKGDSI